MAPQRYPLLRSALRLLQRCVEKEPPDPLDVAALRAAVTPAEAELPLDELARVVVPDGAVNRGSQVLDRTRAWPCLLTGAPGLSGRESLARDAPGRRISSDCTGTVNLKDVQGKGIATWIW